MSTSQAATLDGMNEEVNDSETSETNMTNQSQLNRQFLATDPRRKSPLMASFLSLMPGLGQVYVGYYKRGFTNVLIAGSVFTFLVGTQGQTALNPLGIIFLLFFEFYNIIDASRRATMYNLALDGVEQMILPDDMSEGVFNGNRGSFLGGAILIVFGIVALSNTAMGFSLEWLEEWWPVGPLLLGVYLVFKAYEDSQESEKAQTSDSDSME
ncbi:MAG: hypothetical protein GKR91_10145 [Pseudomonadales bacterium]|nr:hypothetical protein [Pseudomonadales bacterium]